MSTKSLSLAVFVFAAVTLTHAGFVDYRSGAAETQPQYRAVQDKTLDANQMLYLQARKLGGAELLLDVGAPKRAFWKGLMKSRWTGRGLCCGVFELLMRMKGGETRLMILRSLQAPRNKLQLSHELGIDWKAVDNHIAKLLQFSLVQEVIAVGTCRVYSTTQKGRVALELAEDCLSEKASLACQDPDKSGRGKSF